MPDVGDFDYILGQWQEAGIAKSGGMGILALDWQDIKAFSDFNEINSFEAQMIIKLSASYVNGLNMKEHNDRAPYQREYTHDEWLAREGSVKKAEKAHAAKEAQKLLKK